MNRDDVSGLEPYQKIKIFPWDNWRKKSYGGKSVNGHFLRVSGDNIEYLYSRSENPGWGNHREMPIGSIAHIEVGEVYDGEVPMNPEKRNETASSERDRMKRVFQKTKRYNDMM